MSTPSITAQREAVEEMIRRIQPTHQGARCLASFTEDEAELLRAAAKTIRWIEANEAVIKRAAGGGR